MARVLVAMSGGVDSSVAAALLLEQGHDVVGATMKLWGGPSDSGCCSVADVDDARRVAQQLGIDHHVFNFGDDFDALVVEPYVEAHRAGVTPNPCIACNRHLKFDRFLRRARTLGFDAIATGHHARITIDDDGTAHLARGADGAKDQSYVLHVVAPDDLASVMLPVGEMDKAEVRARAESLGLRTAAKPDSQDVCFISITKGGRRAFLDDRLDLHDGVALDVATGAVVGTVTDVELVTVGQRRGLGALGDDGLPRYALSVDTTNRTVTVGAAADLMVDAVAVSAWSWMRGAAPTPDDEVEVQVSAHGQPFAATVDAEGVVRPRSAVKRVAPGQSVVVYDGDRVIGGGTAA